MTVDVYESTWLVYRSDPGLWMGVRRYGWPMHWRDLFDDLEAQLMRADREAFEDEVRERGVAERAAVSLGAVLAAAGGAHLTVTLVDGTRVEGAATDTAAQWLYLTHGAREWLIPASAIAAVDGVDPGAPQPGQVAARLTLGHALRALAEDGGEVVVSHAGTVVRGRISAVGADYLAIAGSLIPFAAILTVSPAL